MLAALVDSHTFCIQRGLAVKRNAAGVKPFIAPSTIRLAHVMSTNIHRNIRTDNKVPPS